MQNPANTFDVVVVLPFDKEQLRDDAVSLLLMLSS
jgi:hypothetical protein